MEEGRRRKKKKKQWAIQFYAVRDRIGPLFYFPFCCCCCCCSVILMCVRLFLGSSFQSGMKQKQLPAQAAKKLSRSAGRSRLNSRTGHQNRKRQHTHTAPQHIQTIAQCQTNSSASFVIIVDKSSSSGIYIADNNPTRTQYNTFIKTGLFDYLYLCSSLLNASSVFFCIQFNLADDWIRFAFHCLYGRQRRYDEHLLIHDSS